MKTDNESDNEKAGIPEVSPENDNSQKRNFPKKDERANCSRCLGSSEKGGEGVSDRERPSHYHNSSGWGGIQWNKFILVFLVITIIDWFFYYIFKEHYPFVILLMLCVFFIMQHKFDSGKAEDYIGKKIIPRAILRSHNINYFLSDKVVDGLASKCFRAWMSHLGSNGRVWRMEDERTRNLYRTMVRVMIKSLTEEDSDDQ